MFVPCLECDRPVENQYAPAATCERSDCPSNRPEKGNAMATQLQDNTRTYTEKELLELGWRPPVAGVDYERWRDALNAFYIYRKACLRPSSPLDDIDRGYIDALIAAIAMAPEPYRYNRV